LLETLNTVERLERRLIEGEIGVLRVDADPQPRGVRWRRRSAVLFERAAKAIQKELGEAKKAATSLQSWKSASRRPSFRRKPAKKRRPRSKLRS
jgi:hypothetical protein